MPDPTGLPIPSYVGPTGGPTPTPTPTPTPQGRMQGWWNEPQTLVPSPEGVFALPGTDPAQAAIEATAPTGEATEGKLGFDEWKISVGMEDAWLTGGASIQKDIWNAYQGYLTGEAVAGEGAAAPLFSPEEERMLTDLTNAISVGQLDEDQAWKQLESYWSGQAVETRKAEEAGTRGRAMMAGAFPGDTLPMTGPGGMGAKLKEQYGLPDLTPAVKGIPMGDVSGIFGQAQQQMGLPETLAPTSPPNIQLPNWGALGQSMPQFGGRNFFEQLLQEGRSTGF